MTQARTALRSGLRACIVTGVAIMVGACTTPDVQFANMGLFEFAAIPADSRTPQDQFPLSVESVRTAIDLAGRDGPERLSASELRRIDEVVTAFMAEQRGQLTIMVPGGAASDARVLGRAKQVSDLAKRRGLAASQILLRVATDDQRADGPVVVSYDRLVMQVPVCGDWSKESSHDVTNTTYSNFGCSLQRDIGSMIADPADLIAPRTAGLHDTARSNIVIRQYRTGAVTGATRAAAEQAAGLTTQ